MARKLLWHLDFSGAREGQACCGSKSTRCTSDQRELTCPKCIANYELYREDYMAWVEQSRVEYEALHGKPSSGW